MRKRRRRGDAKEEFADEIDKTEKGILIRKIAEWKQGGADFFGWSVCIVATSELCPLAKKLRRTSV